MSLILLCSNVFMIGLLMGIGNFTLIPVIAVALNFGSAVLMFEEIWREL